MVFLVFNKFIIFKNEFSGSICWFISETPTYSTIYKIFDHCRILIYNILTSRAFPCIKIILFYFLVDLFRISSTKGVYFRGSNSDFLFLLGCAQWRDACIWRIEWLRTSMVFGRFLFSQIPGKTRLRLLPRSMQYNSGQVLDNKFFGQILQSKIIQYQNNL